MKEKIVRHVLKEPGTSQIAASGALCMRVSAQYVTRQ